MTCNKKSYIKINVFFIFLHYNKDKSNGRGGEMRLLVAEDQLSHIFKRFYRVDRARTGSGKVHATLYFPTLRNQQYPLQ